MKVIRFILFLVMLLLFNGIWGFLTVGLFPPITAIGCIGISYGTYHLFYLRGDKNEQRK